MILVLNLVPVYRRDFIIDLLDKGIKIYAGDVISQKIKRFEDPRIMTLRNHIIFGNWFFQELPIALFRRNKEKLIFTGDLRNLSLLAYLIYNKLFLGNKVVLWTHGLRYRRSIFIGTYFNLFYSLSDELYLYSKDGTTGLWKFLKHRVKIIGNTINTVNHDIKPYTSNGSRDVLFLARIEPRKQLGLAIEALASISIKYNLALHVIGDGELLDFYKDTALRLGVNVFFYGPVYEQQVISRIADQCCAMIIPGDIGLSAVHALSMGLPVITHNRSSKHGPEFSFLDEMNSLLFEYGSRNSLVGKLEELCYKSADEISEWKIDCQRQYLDRFTVEVFVNKFL